MNIRRCIKSEYNGTVSLHEYSLRIKTIMEKITILDTHNNKNNNYRYGNNDLHQYDQLFHSDHHEQCDHHDCHSFHQCRDNH